MKTFVEIEPETYRALEALAKEHGCSSVEELLTKFASDFSNGCSVTLTSAKGAA